MWMDKVKMKRYFHTQQTFLLLIFYVIPSVNVHTNFSFNTSPVILPEIHLLFLVVFCQKNMDFMRE